MVKILKKALVTTIVALSTLVSSTAIASTSPYILMQQTADKLFDDVKTNQSKIKNDPNYLRTIVRNNLMPHVHVKYAGQLVLDEKSLSSATSAQKEQFFNAFGQFIEQFFAQVLTLYTNQKVEIENDKPIQDKKIVQIKVKILQEKGSPINLEFKWRKNPRTNEWQAFDVITDAGSMVSSKKKEWADILSKQGIEALTSRITESAKQPITLDK